MGFDRDLLKRVNNATFVVLSWGGMSQVMSIERVGLWLEALWSWIATGWHHLFDWAFVIFEATTADHVEGASIMALVLLGPSLAIGLIKGFWEGLRIEWRHYQGKPRAIDGDTLEIRGERIRLFGIDAPEIGQPWWDAEGEQKDAGVLAKQALSSLVEGRRLTVNVLREDQYQRSIAIVKIDRKDIARVLVRQGWAFAAPGSTRYRRTEQSAKRRKRGFWRGDVTMPWDYRAIA